jgi:hypothetical protein
MSPVPTRAMEIRIGPPGMYGMAWSTLHMEAEVELDSGSKPNKAKVKLWNLSPSSIAWCERSGQVIQVLAGDGVASQIALMDVLPNRVMTERTDGSLLTTIEAKDGQTRFTDSIFARSYPPGTARALVLADVVAELRYPIGYQSPTLQPYVFAGGFTFVGEAQRCLTEILSIDGTTWTVQGGQLYLVAPGDIIPGTSPLISEATGLMESPKRRDKGLVDFKCRFNPAFAKCGVGFQLQSRWISGMMKTTKIKHHVISGKPVAA